MIKEDKMVSHPGHYEKEVDDGRIHPECIELLDTITYGLPGILALDIGQLKYCYRFGSKAENGMTRREKAIQDVKKIAWYARDAKENWESYVIDIEMVKADRAFKTIATLIAEEFAFDKPTKLKNAVRKVVREAYYLTSKMGSIVVYVNAVDDLVREVENTTDEDWE